MLQHLNVLSDLKGISLSIPTELIRRFSPSTSSIMEFRSQQDLNVLEKIYGKYPLIGENVNGSWNPTFKREFNMTDDRSFFNESGIGWPLYEGKMLHQYTHRFRTPHYYIDTKRGINELARLEIQKVEESLDTAALSKYRFRSTLSTRQSRILALLEEQEHGQLTSEDVMIASYAPRLAFRRVARSTDERTFIATILPEQVFAVDTATYLVPWYFNAIKALNQLNNIKGCYEPTLPSDVLAYLCGTFNSFTLDYVLRFKVKTDVNMFYVYQLPVPRLASNDSHCRAIAQRVARLVCVGPEFDDLRRELLGDVNARVLPFEEKEARQQVQNEIDALVAHLYGLSEEDLHHILYALFTFPLVKREIKDGVMREFARVEQLFREEG